MPWPLFHNMTDHQIEAIYEYLSAIPCIDNTFSTPPAGAPDNCAMIAAVHSPVAIPPRLTEMRESRLEDSQSL